ncbi:DEAD/DEAH box helicase [Acanthopleuribacter pedis]|uniref:DEAD/DEAH box helicase n=1 Tax=Acanthopleuribacter pedis TaxID=442870 RepID=A0A8J7U4W7_9BACT|nr:DEAD/DEAH box helicase [Acanthopleuribacter pedis]MBO1320219.1 DEAD/DEAH box helicase [Acanthopleuribacter pedis]
MSQAKDADVFVPAAVCQQFYDELPEAQRVHFVMMTLAGSLFDRELIAVLSCELTGRRKVAPDKVDAVVTALREKSRGSAPMERPKGGYFTFRPHPAWFCLIASQLAQHAAYDYLVQTVLSHQNEGFREVGREQERRRDLASAPYSVVALMFVAPVFRMRQVLFHGEVLLPWFGADTAHLTVRALQRWRTLGPPRWSDEAENALLDYAFDRVPPNPALNQALFSFHDAFWSVIEKENVDLKQVQRRFLLTLERRLLCGAEVAWPSPEETLRLKCAPGLSAIRETLAGGSDKGIEAAVSLDKPANGIDSLLTVKDSTLPFLFLLRVAVGDDAPAREFLPKLGQHLRSRGGVCGGIAFQMALGFEAPRKVVGKPWYEFRQYFGGDPKPIPVWLYTLVATWLETPNFAVDHARLASAVVELERAGFLWPMWDLSYLIAIRAGDEARQNACRDALAAMGYVPLLTRLPRQEPWEMVLKELDAWRRRVAPAEEETVETTTRLVWVFDFSDTDNYHERLYARFQKYNAKRKNWSKGRRVSCVQFAERSRQFEPLSEADRRFQAQLLKLFHEGVYSPGHKLPASLFEALADHPRVFEELAGEQLVPATLTKGDVQIQVIEDGDRVRLRLSPNESLVPDEDVLVARAGANRLVFYPLDDHLRGIRHILQRGVAIPNRGRDQLRRTLNDLAPLIAIQSDVELDSSAREVAPDQQLYLLLTPMSDVLSVQPAVMPFGDQGPWFQPGSPGRSVTADVNGEKLRTRRDAEAEKNALNNLFRICPALFPFQQVEMPWVLDSVEDCLELLDDLERIREQVTVAWPEGQSMRLAGIAHLGNASMRIKHSRDWFAVEGQVQVNEEMVVGLQELLTLIGEGRHGRFVALADGRFLSLSHEFLRRLQSLQNLNQARDQKRLRYSLSAALSMAPVFEGIADFKGDRKWHRLQEQFAAIEHQDIPIPTTLDGDLRDYQVAGFRWMARLAHCGLGACLADDMGLGKTIQAITLLLRRAADGPALVLAPTSVCYNWEAELRRFAPSLRPCYLGDEDRGKVVTEAGPFDVLIVSHGLLSFVGELLQTRSWHSLVFDEAQAIKNPVTQRAKTARALQAEFRLIMTGTPIENHLGELWSLFQFINPGLLGPRETFNKRFAGPIERQSNREVQRDLQLLVRPFILRRLKRDVLSALPPRTEIELQVALSEEERTVYEALRRDALDRISRMSPGKGNQYLEVLANLMRLRRGVCHPKMVLPEWDKGSAKLRMLASVLDELQANGHRALIFSQFVDHLQLIRDFVKARGMPFQYLDGATPARTRAARVRAFQGGEGDVFLISLKAGGTGLNLTAADYVILMDPWWNPAVEDQAGDRAHRLGQTRPVTIYRLVARHTVEEKIMALHRHKRELAESLLAGTESGAPIDKEVLLRLLAEPS